MLEKKEVYRLLGVQYGNSEEALRVYFYLDQRLTRGGSPWSGWNYDDPTFIFRRVVEAIEEVDEGSLSSDEQRHFNEIRWFYYHHAVSRALQLRDRESALRFSRAALACQGPNHPNRITRLLYLLVRNRVDEAREWGRSAQGKEQDSVRDLLFDYESDQWPFPKAVSRQSES